MAQKSKDCTSVNIGLIVAIVILLIVTISIGCYSEGFNNLLPDYKIPFIGQKVPSLQKLTVPTFQQYIPTELPISEPIPTEEVQVVELDQESMKKIDEAKKTIQDESEKILERREYLRSTRVTRPPQVKRINPRAVAQKPRQQQRQQQRGGAGRR